MSQPHSSLSSADQYNESQISHLSNHLDTQNMSEASKSIDRQFEEQVPLTFTRLSTQEALKQIQAGEALEKCYIDHLTLNGQFDSTISLKQVYIRQLDMRKIESNANITIRGCHIRRLIIDQCTFHDSVIFKHSHCHFMSIKSSQFMKTFNAERSSFNSKVVLHSSIFNGRIRFWEAHFKDWFNAVDCQFKGKVDLRSTTFEAGFTVPNCHFEDDFLFRGSHLALKWEGLNARFEKMIDFSKAKLNDFVYLEDIILGHQQRWSFWNTVSERILVKPDQVEGRLHSEEEGEYDKAMREYAVLKRSFEHENQYSYDDWAFYRFKVNERRARTQSHTSIWLKVINSFDWLLLDWGCGYGTHPLRAIRTALVMIFCFAVIYTIGFSYLHTPEQFPFPDLPPAALLNRFGVSLFVSLAAFTSGFGDLRGVAIGWMNAPIMFEALLGTLMWGLFIVAFGRKVIR